MAVQFACVLTCDVCGKQQTGRATLKALTMTTLLEPGGTEPFELEFDQSVGHQWSVFGGTAVCSSDCKAALWEAQKAGKV